MTTPRTKELVWFTGRDGNRIAGDRVGDVNDPIVVLLHGGGQTRHSWHGTADRLAEHGWCAYSLDLRGHSDSEWSPDADYSLPAFAGDIAAVIDELARPVMLVGASLGGMTSLALGGDLRPEVVTALVLVDITHRAEPEGAQRIGEFMRGAPNGFADLDEAADAVHAYNPHRPRPKDPSGLVKNLRRHDDGRWYWHWDPAFTNPERRRSEADLMAPDYAVTCARALRQPTLLVRGRLSDIVSDTTVAEFRALVPHAEYIDVSDAGHMVAGDRNDVFAAAVIEFLDGVAAT